MWPKKKKKETETKNPEATFKPLVGDLNPQKEYFSN